MLRIMNSLLGKRKGYQTVIFCLIAITLLALIDDYTGFELSFSIFYLLPVGTAAWFAGRRSGIFISVISALAWLFVDHTSGHQYAYWPISLSIGVFVLSRAPENIDEAIKSADNLMYQVKKTGKNNLLIGEFPKITGE